MFKRIDKHLKKKEDQSTDERWKEVLGHYETDSDESASGESDSEGAGDCTSSDDSQDMTVSQALIDPLYVSSPPEVKSCIICPGKVLKGQKMEEMHLTSNAHTRRFKHFSRLAADAKTTKSAQRLFRRYTEMDTDAHSTKPTSKRAEKRKTYHVQLRAKFKEKKKAMKQTVTTLLSPAPIEMKPSTEDEGSHTKQSKLDDGQLLETKLKKKRKPNELETEKLVFTVSHSSPKRQKSVKVDEDSANIPVETEEKKRINGNVTSIVKSTAHRARKARLRSLHYGAHKSSVH